MCCRYDMLHSNAENRIEKIPFGSGWNEFLVKPGKISDFSEVLMMSNKSCWRQQNFSRTVIFICWRSIYVPSFMKIALSIQKLWSPKKPSRNRVNIVGLLPVFTPNVLVLSKRRSLQKSIEQNVILVQNRVCYTTQFSVCRRDCEQT